nr:alpha/beta hydrolase [uncultured Draconibacterium sp.]
MNHLRTHIVSEFEKSKRTILVVILLFITVQLSYSQTNYIAGSPKLAFWKIGNSNEMIIILHGGPAVEHSYLRPEWDTLSSISTICYYDQRGCGKSDTAQSYTWIDHVQDLKRIKETISENGKIILAGSSWGSELALLYSIYFPEDVKALVLSGFCRWNGENPQKIDFNDYINDSLYTFIRKKSKSEYEDSVRISKHVPYQEFFKLNEHIDNPEKELELRMSTNFDINRATANSLKSAPDISFLGKIDIPILAFGKNTVCTYQDWSDVIEDLNSNVNRYIINDSCHDPWFTHPSEFFQECFKFVDNLNDN